MYIILLVHNKMNFIKVDLLLIDRMTGHAHNKQKDLPSFSHTTAHHLIQRLLSFSIKTSMIPGLLHT